MLWIPGVRRGILRVPGALIVTEERLLFVPDEGRGGPAVQQLLDSEDDPDEAVKEVIAAAAVEDEGMAIPRGKPGLSSPDDEGRLWLVAIGAEDDLLIPRDAVSVLRLVMGPSALPATAASPVPSVGNLLLDRPPAAESPGWLGPISGGAGVLAALIGLPVLVLTAVLITEEEDDELGALIFLLGGAVLAMVHLGTFVGATFGFVRNETTRLWGLSTVASAGLSGLFLLAGSLIALEELF